MQDAAQAAADAAALKEKSEREAREALERQLRPRKRKRKTLNREKEDLKTPVSIYMKIGLALLAAALVVGLGLIFKMLIV